MIDIKRKENCVGCGACIDSCSHKAISWEKDIEGFWYPVVNHMLCVNCGLCEKVCPELNSNKLNKTNDGFVPEVYAAYNTDSDVRLKSTTGGLYSALAEKMLKDGGYIGGAVWTDNFQAEHIVSNKPEDLQRLRGSKYFQSDTTGIYSKIKALLNADKRVLVCGCPCQMAALRSFLHFKEYCNLIIIDFICCSINSPKLFRKYIDSLENEYGGKCTSYHPKNKEYGGWHKFAFKATFDNGSVYVKNGIEDDFTNCFIGTHIAARPCCFECKFKSIPRVSDITIADFWGIENVDPEMDSPNGTSLVIINNSKGKSYFDSLGESIFSKRESLDEAAKENGHLYRSLTKSPINRDKFYKLLDKEGFDAAMNTYGRLKETLCRKIIRKVARLAAKLCRPESVRGRQAVN